MITLLPQCFAGALKRINFELALKDIRRSLRLAAINFSLVLKYAMRAASTLLLLAASSGLSFWLMLNDVGKSIRQQLQRYAPRR